MPLTFPDILQRRRTLKGTSRRSSSGLPQQRSHVDSPGAFQKYMFRGDHLLSFRHTGKRPAVLELEII